MTEYAAPPQEDEATPKPVEGFKALGFFTADHAVVENGKVYANGAYWQNLNFPAFPATLPSAAVVAVIQVPWHAHNHDHTIEVALIDSDGRNVPGFEVKGQFRGAPDPAMKYGQPGVMSVAIPIFGLQIERPSDYSFVLRVDSIELSRYTVTVRQVAFPGVGVPPRQQPPSPTAW